MRTVILLGLYGLFCAAATSAIRPVEAAPVPAPEKIVAREIVLVDEGGNVRITLSASKNTSGIWVGQEGSGKGLAAIYEDKDQGAVIGYYGGNRRDFCDFAVSSAGGPTAIQFRGKDGKVQSFELADLKK